MTVEIFVFKLFKIVQKSEYCHNRRLHCGAGGDEGVIAQLILGG